MLEAVIEDNGDRRLYREGGAFPERLVSRRPDHELLGEDGLAAVQAIGIIPVSGGGPHGATV